MRRSPQLVLRGLLCLPQRVATPRHDACAGDCALHDAIGNELISSSTSRGTARCRCDRATSTAAVVGHHRAQRASTRVERRTPPVSCGDGLARKGRTFDDGNNLGGDDWPPPCNMETRRITTLRSDAQQARSRGRLAGPCPLSGIQAYRRSVPRTSRLIGPGGCAVSGLTRFPSPCAPRLQFNPSGSLLASRAFSWRPPRMFFRASPHLPSAASQGLTDITPGRADTNTNPARRAQRVASGLPTPECESGRPRGFFPSEAHSGSSGDGSEPENDQIKPTFAAPRLHHRAPTVHRGPGGRCSGVCATARVGPGRTANLRAPCTRCRAGHRERVCMRALPLSHGTAISLLRPRLPPFTDDDIETGEDNAP